MALDIRNILNSSALDGSTSSSLATQPSSLTFEFSPGASSCPRSLYTPIDLSGTAPGQAAPTKQPLQDGTIEDVGSQYLKLHPPIEVSVGSPLAISNPVSLRSQALTTPHGARAPLATISPSHAPSRPQPPPSRLEDSHSPNMQAGWPLPSPPSETASSWPETLQNPGMRRSSFGVEGQPAFMRLPGTDTPILVQVDFSQASKQSDEKRQRNALASTRHRRKKKIMQEEKSKQLQELRDYKRMMEISIDKLTQQRDFYREDRNCLRDIVKQTPSISGLATRPPSPTISTINSYAEAGSLPSGPSGFIGYGGYALPSGEPAKYRRADDHLEYSLPHRYIRPVQSIPMQDCGSLTGLFSESGKRLPPLRAMEGRPPEPAVQEQDPRTGQWIPPPPRGPETGWATTDTHQKF